MYTVFLPIGGDKKMEVQCSNFDELVRIIDHYGLGAPRPAPSRAEGTPTRAATAPAANAYVAEKRLEHVKAAIRDIGKPAMPKDIADILQADEETRMDVKSPTSAVRYILRTYRDKEFVREHDGWWLKDTPSAEGSSIFDFQQS